MGKDGESKTPDVVSREYTIHLHKRVHGVGFKKKAPRAIKEIRKFARKEMGTADVRIDTGLNKFLWSRGVRNIPRRLRVLLSRRRNEDEEADEELYTLASYVPCADFHGLTTVEVKPTADEEA
eukprot:PLAT15907.1.p2 GENE.PLAT15907.1~~PLAT15907.1.p2  ORF type:complete len:123 (-),score=61.56 PLAT15907.1:258-626(-)